ncbi:flagellar hook-associated protein 2 [Silvibacterium bohemicum]|uniref:Flagellar hook-associated protein 2 n=1 Tax=Silvibacterium bohemicum TaxID=1577686 RepID=A0A841JYZ2_9BACT|nr:flagellar filament capping protein FliD [Silvibacterium bohemicum]MBB6146546.1 flagellar hook-associated protein 2 [Silvibacterium bohemicum]
MSTVGISFGSPTSGQGFDVSSTVSQIVANLQAVETPWNTQLSALQSQDTALSSIGTDLSSLASALNPLTDFAGVFSEKEGSSSDTSVLALTSAASDAAAGTYTVKVDSLAQTSSYASGILATNDTLATGSTLSLSVGSNSQTITIDSANDTLSTLAAAINAGSYGVTANVITTSTGQQLSLVSNTSGAAGQITVGGSLIDGTTGQAVTFTQGQPGQDASLTVDGVAIGSASNTITGAIPGVTFQLVSAAPGSAVQVEITNNNSDIESALTSFVSSYNTVIGDLNTQESNDASGNAEPLYGDPTVATLQQDLQSALNFTQAANAVGTTSSIESSDTLSGSLSISVGSGAATTIAVPANGTLASLADAINAANLGVTASVQTAGNSATLSVVNSTAGSSGAITINSGSLTDSTTGSAVTFAPSQSNAITSLTQLGVSMNNDGTLSLNTDTLDSVLDSNYQDVVNFLEPSASFTSFGSNLTNILNNLGNSTSSGVVVLALSSNSSSESQLNTNLSNENAYISSQQSQLTTELNEANYTLQAIPEQLDEVNELYSAITGFNENSSN